MAGSEPPVTGGGSFYEKYIREYRRRAKSLRRENGLDFIERYFATADEALVYLVPHFGQMDINTRGYPNFVSGPYPMQVHIVKPDDILLPPVQSSLWILRPDKFDPGPTYHQSTSASLINPREDEFLLPAVHFRLPNTKRQHFNLGALVRGGNPLANLVSIRDFLWGNDGVVREDAWQRAVRETFNDTNLAEYVEAIDTLVRLLMDRKIDKSELPEFRRVTERIGIGYDWQRRMEWNDWMIQRIADDWSDRGYENIIFHHEVKRMLDAARQLPADIRSFLDNPFPVLYVIDTNAQPDCGLPAIPRLFVDTRDVLKRIYGEQASQLLLRSPYVQTPLPPIEGRRIMAIFIPDEEIDGPRFSIIQTQVRKFNPHCRILGQTSLSKSSFAPSWKAESCERLYGRAGITMAEIESLKRTDLVKLFAPDIGVGPEKGIYDWSEINRRKVYDQADRRMERISIGR